MVAFELRIVLFTVEVSAFKMIGSFGDVIIRSLPCDVIARAHLALLSQYSQFAWRNLVTKIRLHFISSVSPGYSTLCAGTCSRHQSSINSSS